MNRIESARESARFARQSSGRNARSWHVLACIEALTESPDAVWHTAAQCEQRAKMVRNNARLRRYWARLAVAARLIAADRVSDRS